MAGVQFRDDVAAVGLIAYDVDVFVIGAIISNDPSYHLLVYETSTASYVYLEGAIGSLLGPNASLPAGYTLHYFKASQGAAPYPQSMSHVVLTPYTDPAGTTPVTSGAVLYPTVASNGVCTLTIQVPAAGWPGLQLASNDPIEAPSIGQPALGYKYTFYASALQTGKLAIQASTPVYQAQGNYDAATSPTLQGIPFGINPSLVTEGSSYSAIFLPLNWWIGVGSDPSVAVCSTQVSTTGGTLQNLIWSMCDRFGALGAGGTTSAFYTANCTNIDSYRGNINQSDCVITQGAMYYLPDGFTGSTGQPATQAPSRCGIGWAPNTSFRDMTDSTITGVANPYGGCWSPAQLGDPGVCQFGSTGTAACAPLDLTSSTPCTTVDTSNCTTNCDLATVSDCTNDCSSCAPDCADANIKTSPSTLMWIIIAILAVIAIGLFLMVMHDGTKKKQDKHAHANKYDYGPGAPGGQSLKEAASQTPT